MQRIDLFKCPNNDIPTTAVDQRKCGLDLDYGLSNRASQNYRYELDPADFLASDMTWGLAFVQDSGGPNREDELDGWWMPFVHPAKLANVARPDGSVRATGKSEFIAAYTASPPDDDSL